MYTFKLPGMFTLSDSRTDIPFSRLRYPESYCCSSHCWTAYRIITKSRSPTRAPYWSYRYHPHEVFTSTYDSNVRLFRSWLERSHSWRKSGNHHWRRRRCNVRVSLELFALEGLSNYYMSVRQLCASTHRVYPHRDPKKLFPGICRTTSQKRIFSTYSPCCYHHFTTTEKWLRKAA